jgi:diguanylate cyclase (GGDEF)-like protein
VKVLIADDDPISRRLLETHVAKWGYEAIVAGDGAEAWGMLQREDAPRLAVLDWMMPGMDGPHICREIRRCADRPYTYLLLLTAKSRKEDIVEGMEAGADDFLTKPFDAQELKARLRAAKRILDLEEALRVQSLHDALTGLWNRAAIFNFLQRELNRGKRQGFPMGVAMADVDHFKRINDTHGYLVGDGVLREVARKIESCVRAYDGVGRFGGEEFLIVFPGCDVELSSKLAERLRASVSAAHLEVSGVTIPVTLSLGVAAEGVAKTSEINQLLRIADGALYRAKSGGRNRVERGTALDPPLPSPARQSSRV